MRDRERSYGLTNDGRNVVPDRKQLHRYITLKLAALGIPMASEDDKDAFLHVAGDLLATYQEQSRLLSEHACPIDTRIQAFLDDSLQGLDTGSIRLPRSTFILDRHGLARELSLPLHRDHYDTALIESRRLKNGVLHNPVNDRRTTKGVFHVADGGLPVPGDKRAVPMLTYGRLLHHALHRVPDELLELPYTADAEQTAKTFVTLLLRPLVSPAVPGFSHEKRTEIRFFAPGNLVANLDFVESIFGNAGDPNLAENDAGLDTQHWTGHSGCVILAPHMVHLTKGEVGLPHRDEASPRQLHDGMFYDDPSELYNDGQPFKITHRDHRGIMVTLIADNYFGYCKKEVKTQISYSANLYGLAEEEHAGGALAFPSYGLGQEFHVDSSVTTDNHCFAEALRLLGDRAMPQPEGHAIDAHFPQIVYVPEDMTISIQDQRVSWTREGETHAIKLLPGKYYVHPSGYKVSMQKHPASPAWRLIGIAAVGTFCHKPCTVSGGGKSEISKSLTDAIIYGPIYVADLEADLDLVQEIFDRDYSDRLKKQLRPDYTNRPSRPVLSQERSLGSVIKLFTPSDDDFTPAYNAWLATIPKRILALVFVIKRFYKQEWGRNWRQHFHVDIVNGEPGHEFKYGSRTLVGSYLRVGLDREGDWRTFKLRQDFIPAAKVQMEDDISASIVVPAATLGRDGEHSLKLVQNCEHRLFQRPDDAIHRGYDKQTEWDMSQPGLFSSNYEPLDSAKVAAEVENVINFDLYTEPMKKLFGTGVEPGGFLVSSARPRIVAGVRTKNPRYLQIRPDLMQPCETYLAEIGTRLHLRVPSDKAVVYPVDAVLTGRRNNPPEPQIKPLAVYGPIHYQELPELFMDFVSSLTGKSPSTTGAGSEGALTKGPFNALRPTPDLNNALVSYIITGHNGFSSAAGHIGRELRVDHDVSLLVPEIWCRMRAADLHPQRLIDEGHLEAVEDFEYEGRLILGSRLGYRITSKFIHTYFGKIFDSPAEVFDERILRPEKQGLEDFVDGIENITGAQQRVAAMLIEDGSVEDACPPLQALLHIMASGSFEGMNAKSPAFRRMFTREALLGSDWYQERLEIKRDRERDLWQRHVAYLERFIARRTHAGVVDGLKLRGRLQEAQEMLARVDSAEYLDSLRGTLGADPVHAGIAARTVAAGV